LSSANWTRASRRRGAYRAALVNPSDHDYPCTLTHHQGSGELNLAGLIGAGLADLLQGRVGASGPRPPLTLVK